MSRGAKYPLRAVEDLRRRRRDAAREELAERIEATRLAEEAAGRAAAKQQSVREELSAARRGLYEPPLDVALIDARRRGIEALERRLAAAASERVLRDEAAEKARQEETHCRDELNLAARELEALEKHRARWRAGIDLEERRRDARAVDEFVTSAFSRRRAAGSTGDVP